MKSCCQEGTALTDSFFFSCWAVKFILFQSSCLGSVLQCLQLRCRQQFANSIDSGEIPWQNVFPLDHLFILFKAIYRSFDDVIRDYVCLNSNLWQHCVEVCAVFFGQRIAGGSVAFLLVTCKHFHCTQGDWHISNFNYLFMQRAVAGAARNLSFVKSLLEHLLICPVQRVALGATRAALLFVVGLAGSRFVFSVRW